MTQRQKDTLLELAYAVTAVVVALALLLTVHMRPRFIGPQGTRLCAPGVCLALNATRG